MSSDSEVNERCGPASTSIATIERSMATSRWTRGALAYADSTTVQAASTTCSGGTRSFIGEVAQLAGGDRQVA